MVETIDLLLGIEILTLSLVTFLHIRLRKIAKAWVGKIIRSLNLVPGGEGPTLRERLRSSLGGGESEETPKTKGKPSKADALVADLAEQLGTDSEGLIEM